MRYKRVYIEITNQCNLNCEYCSKSQKLPRSMSIPEFSRVIEQIKPNSSNVYFHIKGEPLMHPNLVDFFSICEKNEIKVNITTNGTLLKQKQDILLNSKALRQVNLSLHTLTQLKDNNDYLSNIVEFIQKIKGVYVVLRIWNLDGNNNIDVTSQHTLNYLEKQLNCTIPALKGRESVRIGENLFVGFEQQFEWPSLSHSIVGDSGYCYGLRHQIGILADGTVVPCCLDADGITPLGNIFISEFKDIIMSDQAKAIRHGFEHKEVYAKLCKRCSFRTRFDT